MRWLGLLSLTVALLLSAAATAISADTGAITITYSFAVDAATPTVPVLSSPADLSSTATVSLAFDWGDSTDDDSGVSAHALVPLQSLNRHAVSVHVMPDPPHTLPLHLGVPFVGVVHTVVQDPQCATSLARFTQLMLHRVGVAPEHPLIQE